jgi:methylase of polypeptide subunit release factors
MPLGAAIGLVAALHDLHGEWDLIFSNPPWVARPLHTLRPLVTTSVLHTFDT